MWAIRSRVCPAARGSRWHVVLSLTPQAEKGWRILQQKYEGGEVFERRSSTLTRWPDRQRGGCAGFVPLSQIVDLRNVGSSEIPLVSASRRSRAGWILKTSIPIASATGSSCRRGGHRRAAREGEGAPAHRDHEGENASGPGEQHLRLAPLWTWGAPTASSTSPAGLGQSLIPARSSQWDRRSRSRPLRDKEKPHDRPEHQAAPAEPWTKIGIITRGASSCGQDHQAGTSAPSRSSRRATWPESTSRSWRRERSRTRRGGERGRHGAARVIRHRSAAAPARSLPQAGGRVASSGPQPAEPT